MYGGTGGKSDGDTGQVKRAFIARCDRLDDGPKDTETLIPGTCYFIGKCDFAGMTRLSWVMPVDPKCLQKCPYKRKAEGGFSVEEKAMRRWTGETTRDAMLLPLKMVEEALSQGMRGTQA